MTKDTQSPEPQGLPLHKRAARAGLRSVIVIVLLLAVLVGGISYMMGKPIAAPEWVQTRIEARLASELPQARVTFGEMEFVLDEGWRPRVRLRNVVIKTPEGAEIVAFTEVKSSFAMRPLLKGQVQPRNLDLSGVFASLERGLDGKVSLRGGVGVGGPVRQAATLPLLIGQLDMILQSPALSTLRDVSMRALTLRYEDLGANRAWTVDGGRVLLSRRRGDLKLSADLAVLGGGAGAATLSANYTSTIGQTAADFGVTIEGVDARDIAAQSPAFAWMSVLRAPISGAVRSGLTSSGALKSLNATLQIGAGVVQPNNNTAPIPFDGARSYFSYDPQSQVLLFDELSVKSAWVSGQLSGEAVLNGVNEGKLSDLVAQFQLRKLVANPGGFYSEPVEIAEASIDMQISLNPFVLRVGQLQVSDQGKTLVLDGTLRAEAAGWNAAVNGQMDGITPERLLALWPEDLKPKTRSWLVDNVYAATLSNIDLAFRRIPDTAPQTYLAFDYDAAEVRFLRSMPNITNGRGHGSLLKNRLVVSLDQGTVTAPEGGDVTVTGSSFIMPDVRVKDGPPAIVRLATSSGIKAALSLLDQPPLEVMKRTKLPITIAQGKAVLKGTLAFPLKKGGGLAAVDYHVTGKLQQLNSDTLVKGRLIEARELALVANNREVRIGGEGQFDGVGFDGTWVQPIGPGSDKSRITGRVDLTPEALKTFNIALPPGTVSGAGKGQIALELARGQRPAYSLSSDLRGLRIQVPQLSWVKPPKASGQLRVSGRLGKTPTVDVLRLEGAGLSAQGSVTLKHSGGLDRVRFDRLAVGDWLNIPVDLIGKGAGRPLQLVIRGGSLDLRRAQFGAGGGGGASANPGPPMVVSLERLQITDTFALTGMTGRFTTGGGLSGPFQARLNGGTAVAGTVLPQGGRSAVRLTSSDAGGVLRSADLVQQVVGGALDLTLLPVGRGGAFDGRLRISDVRIKDAPGIAALINAVSVVGLINELNGDGIYFDDVEAEFRLTPDQLTLTKSSAVGNSLGVSMDGIFGLKSGQISMQGVVTPVYLLNGIGSVLTRKGEGLIGMNYTLSGAAKSPIVSVNPLSALTPGMFREIFRRPAPELPEVDGIANSTLPPVAPETQKRVVPEYSGR